MAGRLLIDTNAYVAFCQGVPGVRETLETAETLALCSIVLGELFDGFKGGSREQSNREQLAAFLARPGVGLLFQTPQTVEADATIALQLRRAGTPIPTNDVWIAACALEHDPTVLTFDHHFSRIAGLSI